jgi:hypothetical protein
MMKKLAYILAAQLLIAGAVYLSVTPKDDAQMGAFKQAAAVFVRSGKTSAPLRDVLGRGGDRICATFDVNGRVEITIQEGKVLTVMKGRGDASIDGKSYLISFLGEKNAERTHCADFAAATIRLQDPIRTDDDSTYLVISDPESLGAALARAKPKSAPVKKKPVPAPEKKKPVQRSYGY